jgi:hypothetical protein
MLGRSRFDRHPDCHHHELKLVNIPFVVQSNNQSRLLRPLFPEYWFPTARKCTQMTGVLCDFIIQTLPGHYRLGKRSADAIVLLRG